MKKKILEDKISKLQKDVEQCLSKYVFEQNDLKTREKIKYELENLLQIKLLDITTVDEVDNQCFSFRGKDAKDKEINVEYKDNIITVTY